jgi:hypothetical protein
MELKKITALALGLALAAGAFCQYSMGAYRGRNIDTVKKRRLFVHAGLYASMDAEAVYFAPTVKAGAGYQIQPKFSAQLFGHYFSGRLRSGGERGDFSLFSAGILAQFHLGKRSSRGMYAGLGMCRQFYDEKYTGPSVTIDDQRNYFAPVYTAGYLFYSGGNRLKFAIEFFGTGPYNENNAGGSYTEILTQASLGVKMIF